MVSQQPRIQLPFSSRPAGWQTDVPCPGVFRYIAPDQEECRYFINGLRRTLKQATEKLGVRVEIVCGDKVQATFGEIKPQPMISTPNYRKLNEILPPLEDPEFWKIADEFDGAVWLFSHYEDLPVIRANRAALDAQAKSDEEILGKAAEALDLPEELEKIRDFLERDGEMEAHQFPGFRWVLKDIRKGKNIYGRQLHNFTEHWKLVTMPDGSEARLGVVLDAEPGALL